MDSFAFGEKDLLCCSGIAVQKNSEKTITVNFSIQTNISGKTQK